MSHKPTKTRAGAKALLAQCDPRSLTLDELAPFVSAYMSKKHSGKPVRARIELPCSGCGRMLSARERRYACPGCGARNRKLSVTERSR